MTASAKFDQFTKSLEMLCRQHKVSLGVLARGNLVVMDIGDDIDPFVPEFCMDGTVDPDARQDH